MGAIKDKAIKDNCPIYPAIKDNCSLCGRSKTIAHAGDRGHWLGGANGEMLPKRLEDTGGLTFRRILRGNSDVQKDIER
jgi:hypothetical protein